MTPRSRIDVPSAGFLLGALALALGAPLAAPSPAHAALPTGFRDSLVVAGLTAPCGMAFLPDGRLLVVEQFTRNLKLVRQGAVVYSVRIPGVRTGGERGLLGVAVHPQWPERPYLYVCLTDTSSQQLRVTRYLALGDLDGTGDGLLAIDLASRRDILDGIPDNASNHNGGTVRFGPDGMLYASFGEDASACQAQDVTALRGVILRVNVDVVPDGPGPAPPKDLISPVDNPFFAHPTESARPVWAFGLRNPFRFHIDLDGTLFIADVGAGTWEEIDRVPAGGLNLGWPYYEGPSELVTSCALTSTPTPPIHAYDRTGSTAAVISAGVYRRLGQTLTSFGSAYLGDYFFGDYYLGWIRRLKRTGDTWALAAPVPGQPNATDWATGYGAVSDYLLGSEGGLWVCRQGAGEIRVILGPAAPPPLDVPPPVAAALSFAPPVPSPSSGAVRLSFTLAAAAAAELTLYDMGGRRVRTLLAAAGLAAGPHEVVWDGADAAGRRVPAGLYFARLRAGGETLDRRVVRVN
jgi:glucose/arabinose dehydrogenase